MGVREFMNNNSAVVTIGAVVLLVLALGAIIWQNKGSGRSVGTTEMYFLDMNEGTLFVRPATEIPPIDAPSGPYQGGPGGFKVYIFTCGQCADFEGMSIEQVQAQGAFIAWLESYTPQAKQQMTSGQYAGPMMMMDGRLIKRLEDENWLAENTPDAINLQQIANQPCPDGERPKGCYPGR